MRKVTAHVAAAFAVRKPIRIKATVCDGSAVTLHGNEIARHNPDGTVTLTLAGWGTTTTRERLNGIARALWGTRAPVFSQRGHGQYVTTQRGTRMLLDARDTLTFDANGNLSAWADPYGAALIRPEYAAA